jgi:hypothetical protein
VVGREQNSRTNKFRICECVCSTAMFWLAGSIGGAVKHHAPHWTDTLQPQQQKQQRSRPKAWPFLFESHPGVSTNPAAPDTTFVLLIGAQTRCGSHSTKPAVRVTHNLTVCMAKCSSLNVIQQFSFLLKIGCPSGVGIDCHPLFWARIH